MRAPTAKDSQSRTGRDGRTINDGDDAGALALVISLNVQRRDMAPSQRALVAARALPMFEEAAKQRMAEGGKKKGMNQPCIPSRTSREEASKTFKVSINAVQQAKALLADAPDLVARVDGGSLSLALAQEGWTQARVAAWLGVGRVTVTDWLATVASTPNTGAGIRRNAADEGEAGAENFGAIAPKLSPPQRTRRRRRSRW